MYSSYSIRTTSFLSAAFRGFSGMLELFVIVGGNLEFGHGKQGMRVEKGPGGKLDHIHIIIIDNSFR